MTFDTEKQYVGKTPVQIVELTLLRCSRRCGVSPCTGSTSGPSKCYNTLATCQDVANYVSEPFVIHVANTRIDELQAVNGCPCFYCPRIAPQQKSRRPKGWASAPHLPFPSRITRITIQAWTTISWKEGTILKARERSGENLSLGKSISKT
jgi:hypothetical protein